MKVNRFCNGGPLGEGELKSIVIQDPVVLDIVRLVQSRLNDRSQNTENAENKR